MTFPVPPAPNPLPDPMPDPAPRPDPRPRPGEPPMPTNPPMPPVVKTRRRIAGGLRPCVYEQ